MEADSDGAILKHQVSHFDENIGQKQAECKTLSYAVFGDCRKLLLHLIPGQLCNIGLQQLA